MLRLYDPLNKRLIYIREKTSPDFWDKHWQKSMEETKPPTSNRFTRNTMHRYLHYRKGIVLEGGCGAGDKVYCMHNDGYNVVGTDFAEKTIHRVKQTYPELNLIVADCFYLPFKSEIFIAYWSLGVIEHFWNGYDGLIAEISRVLEKNGYLFITFPSMSPLRKIKATFGLFEKYTTPSSKIINTFYQFALNEDEVIKKFLYNGFRLLEKKRYDVIKGLKDEINFLKPILQKFYDSPSYYARIGKFVLNSIITGITGHMSFLVFKKAKV